jgi:hypothetical protein
MFDIGKDAAREASKFYAEEAAIWLEKDTSVLKVGPVKVGDQVYQLYEWVKKKN